MDMHRFLPQTLAVAAAVATLSSAAMAQEYPSKTVTVIVPFAPGGSVDTVGRLYADALSQKLGQQFVVENRPGAAGNIGYADAARAENDGYTLLLGFSSTSVCNPALFPKLNWNSETDLTPIAIVTTAPLALLANAAEPYSTATELVEYLKAAPNSLNYGSSGVGSQAHLGGILFQAVTGTEMTHVPYKGSGDLATDLLGGQLQLAFGLPATFVQHIKDGKIKALGVAAQARDPNLPDVPTMREQGIDLVVEGWHGLFAPAGTPPEIVAKLETAVSEISADEAFVANAFEAGNLIRYTGSEDAKARIHAEMQSCADLVKSAGISIE